MKKTFTLIAIIALLFSLIGCNSSKETDDADKDTGNKATITEAPEAENMPETAAGKTVTLEKSEYGNPVAGFDAEGNETYGGDPSALVVGDTLYLYTDGVTEAKDVNDKLFGDDRLYEVLNEHASLRPDKLLETVKKKVLAYEEGTEQADDITMLGLRYNVKTQEFPAKIDCQDKAMDFVNSELKAANCPQKVMAQIDISFEEIFVNIANYAYAPANDGTMTLSCAVGGAPEFVTLTFKDSGKPFNPLKKPDPDITLGLEDREIGNLGIFMVKKIMDSVTYEYKNGQNILTLKKKSAILETFPPMNFRKLLGKYPMEQ